MRRKGKPEYPEKNLSEQKREATTNSTHIMASTPGFEAEPHWWEANALTTAPSLSPPSIEENKCHKNSTTVTATTTPDEDLTNLRKVIALKKNTLFSVEVHLFF